MSTNVVFMLYDSVESIEFVEIIFTSFNSSWFPITTDSSCFDVPTLKIVCTFMLGLDDEHPLCVIQLEVELHLLVEDIISSISTDAYENSFLMWLCFSPFCSHLGRIVVVWGTSTLYGTLFACIMWFHDIFVKSKCMWQICNVLQIYDWTSDF